MKYEPMHDTFNEIPTVECPECKHPSPFENRVVNPKLKISKRVCANCNHWWFSRLTKNKEEWWQS